MANTELIVFKKETIPFSKRVSVLWKQNPTFIIGLILVVFILIIAVIGPKIAPYDPIENNYQARLVPPNAQHLFGTDKFGRDIFSRVLAGAQIDMQIGIICTIILLIIGTVIGLISGYSGGLIDNILMRIVDISVSFPYLVLVIMIISILGPGTINMFFALIITNWISYAKIIRGEVLVAKNMEYVLAAKALGYSSTRILLKHLLPNTISPAIIYMMSAVVMSILSGASLGYLGLGVQAPAPEWGVMIAMGREFVTLAPWLAIFPGLAIAFVGISFAMLGDGISTMLRPADR